MTSIDTLIFAASTAGIIAGIAGFIHYKPSHRWIGFDSLATQGIQGSVGAGCLTTWLIGNKYGLLRAFVHAGLYGFFIVIGIIGYKHLQK